MQSDNAAVAGGLGLCPQNLVGFHFESVRQLKVKRFSSPFRANMAGETGALLKASNQLL